jgi:hypothetical protein
VACASHLVAGVAMSVASLNEARINNEREETALVGARAVELARALYGRIRERPLTSLALAVGVGFLVGGALSFRAGRFALVAAARRVAEEVLRQVL